MISTYLMDKIKILFLFSAFFLLILFLFKPQSAFADFVVGKAPAYACTNKDIPGQYIKYVDPNDHSKGAVGVYYCFPDAPMSGRCISSGANGANVTCTYSACGTDCSACTPVGREACNQSTAGCFWHAKSTTGDYECLYNSNSKGEACPDEGNPDTNSYCYKFETCNKYTNTCEAAGSDPQGQNGSGGKDDNSSSTPDTSPSPSSDFQCNGGGSNNRTDVSYSCSNSPTCSDLSDGTWNISGKNFDSTTSCDPAKFCCYKVVKSNAKLNYPCEPKDPNACAEGECKLVDIGGGIYQYECKEEGSTTPSTDTTTPAPGGADTNNANSCEDVDPPYNNHDPKVFFCETNGCTGNHVPYSTAASYSPSLANCANGGTCCYDAQAYKNRKIQGGGGGGTTPGTSSSPSPSTGPSDECSAFGMGHNDSSIGGQYPGYIGPACDKHLIKDTDPLTAKPGRTYSDIYQCTGKDANGKNLVYVEDKNSNPVCDKFPWIDDGKTVAKCYANGDTKKTNPIDCSVGHDPSWTCTFDYTKDGIDPTQTHCSPDGKRWCAVASTWVPASQGCPGLKSGIGQGCQGDSDCEDQAAGASCKAYGSTGQKTCQWNGASPTPTPGVSNNCTLGFKGTGCACASQTSCGCATSHNPELSLDGDGKYYCVPFATGERWCQRTQSTMPVGSDQKCQNASPYSTLTPTPSPTSGPSLCPQDNNHMCVSAVKQCVANFSPSGDTAANDWCTTYVNNSPAICMKRTTGTTVCSDNTTPAPTVTSATTTPSPTVTATPKPSLAPGCPLDNGDGRQNSCMAQCGGLYPNPRDDSEAELPAGTGACKYDFPDRPYCCTTN